ncbi:DUF2971 domain-containing protein [Phaeobacter inhibens]|uniref:DUF2971 domain-containing protein n=1 Tax=Phaeobacter inhibens TaxID=221822 RepID=A0A2I7KAF4_9RHOB|nr:DUF2971 domain-containing protein [Phaeobacter inhibens]AUQ99553.1 hypothetical protein PhaeoP88_02192 [Phaeobacter inhibens]
MPRLYHFTGSEFSIENIQKRHLKISFANEVNDIFELTPFDFGDDETGRVLRRKWAKSVAKHAETQGFLCFSHSWQSPAMWGHYAQNHKGVCYGFDVEPENPDALLKVRYIDKLKPFNRIAISDRSALNAELAFANCTKSDIWEYEREWRVYCSLNTEEVATKARGGERFFVSFGESLKLKEVIIGAKSSISSDEIRSALRSDDIVRIITARASFREYKIVEQKKDRLKK